MSTTRILHLEIRDQDCWRPLGSIRLLGEERHGLNAKTEFSYDLDYATEFIDRDDFRAASCLAPVGFEPVEFPGWPPFLLDLFPQGAALRYIVDHYRIADQPENYWKIIQTARLNPPGNIRVVTSPHEKDGQGKLHRGFERREVLAKGADFLEYMIEHGAPVAGTTGAAGAAPKFLLREDQKGHFHADGSLPDHETKQCWLVKFPRGRTRIDEDILRVEKTYGDLARHLGLRVYAPLEWEKNCLFIPRFDRPRERDLIQYLGLESFYSLVGLPEFGSRLLHETYIHALAKFSTSPEGDVIEYVLREFSNVMLGNTDNHGRNSSVLKGDGWIKLSPLYDFAPMKFDPEGIVRNTRWGPKTEEGKLDAIANFLDHHAKVKLSEFQKRLAAFYKRAVQIEALLEQHGVPKAFQENTAGERQRLLSDIATYLGRRS